MNDVVEIVGQYLDGLRFHGPYLLMFVAGVGVAWMYWRLCPVPALLTLIASLIKLASAFAYATVRIIFLIHRNDLRSYEFAAHVIAVVDAGAYALLIYAIFYGRSAMTRRSPYWNDEPEEEDLRPGPPPLPP